MKEFLKDFLNLFHKENTILCLFLTLSFCVLSLAMEYSVEHPYDKFVEEVHAQKAEEEKEIIQEVEEATTEEVVPTEPVKVYTIVIDPGHGGNDSGVMFHSDEGEINEKTVNFKIAKYMKEYLEEYDNVRVLLTRTEDKYLELQERTDFARDNNADLLVSLHNNSMEDAGGYASGCSVCVALGNYNEEVGLASQQIGANIAYELSQIGIKNNGLVMRQSMDNEYDNGKPADYFAIVRYPLMENIPAVIVEHGFLDNPDDFYDYLCSDKQLQKVARADCTGIARYLQLTKTDTKEVLDPLKDYRIKICLMRRHKATKRFHRVYYPSN